MEKESFRAVGFERRVFGRLAELLQTVGLLQFLVFLLYTVLTPNVPETEVYVEVFWISLALLVVSIGALWFLPLLRDPTGVMEVSVLERKAGDKVVLSYESTKGIRRDSMTIKSVRAKHDTYLMRPFLRASNPVKDTAATLLIVFESPKVALELGFHSNEELDRACNKLKGFC